jgi:hypothetical protein
MTDLLVLLTLHFVGDFLLQTDQMALNKSKSWKALADHVLCYLAPFTLWCLWAYGRQPLAGSALAFLLVTGAAHYLTDAATSRWTSRLWFIDLYPRPDEERVVDDDQYHPRVFQRFGAYPFYARIIPNRRHWFFVVIGLDQLLHAVQLGLTFQWLLAR